MVIGRKERRDEKEIIRILETRSSFSFAQMLSPFLMLILVSSCPSEKVARKHARENAKDE